jgi:hypothetical protein
MNMVGWQGTADIDKEEKQTGDETQVRYWQGCSTTGCSLRTGFVGHSCRQAVVAPSNE